MIPALPMIGLGLLCSLPFPSPLVAQATMDVRLRSLNELSEEQFDSQTWKATETAIIVCDVWDYHHCLNAVRRITEFAPRLNQVLSEARRRGVIIIHAPSDCMDAYANRLARKRAVDAPKSNNPPANIVSWCSSIPSEELAKYPIDQSDGGEDDDPLEHARWAHKLEALGRNPKSPWKQQTELLTIDDSVDYISDRGDEVWNVLENRAIKNVILVGVHTNMCVLGRPFGLRQMVRGNKNVVLMRDMTDTMYNPQRWPYVSHFEGTRRIISHIERHVCPTISSDQIIGGEEFRFQADDGLRTSSEAPANPERDWMTVSVPDQVDSSAQANRWYRCVVRIPKSWLVKSLVLETNVEGPSQAWINGAELETVRRGKRTATATIRSEDVNVDDANLLVVRTNSDGLLQAPVLRSGALTQRLAGNWQLRVGDDPDYRNMPLPAKFGAGPDIVFTLKTGRNP